jgi:tetratricopeptide (TPR) repeat protein
MTKGEWRKATVDDQKKKIAASLKELTADLTLRDRLRYILNEIQILENKADETAQIRRFIYIISALYHHQRYGGLSLKQMTDLENLAEALLKINRIKPKSSRLSFLYNDLHTVISEIYLKSGDIFESLLQRQLGIHLSQKTPYMQEYNTLSMAIYAMRMGQTTMAIDYYQQLVDKGESLASFIKERSYIGLVRAYRLTHRFDEAQELSRQALEIKDARPSLHLELQWEHECRMVSQSGNLLPLLSKVKKKRSHYAASYILEAFLYTRAMATTRYFKNLPKLTSLIQYKDLDIDKNAPLYLIARQIEAAYDTEIIFKKRLSDMKIVFRLIKSVRNIDKELLVWLALTRWFFRNRYMELASFAFAEYEALSSRLTSGQSQDVLLLAADLRTVPWSQKILESS